MTLFGRRNVNGQRLAGRTGVYHAAEGYRAHMSEEAQAALQNILSERAEERQKAGAEVIRLAGGAGSGFIPCQDRIDRYEAFALIEADPYFNNPNQQSRSI